MEKNKLQWRTRSRQAHIILFLGYWRHKSKMMAVGFACTDGCWSSCAQEVVSDPIIVKCVDYPQNRVLLPLVSTFDSPLIRVLYHLPC